MREHCTGQRLASGEAVLIKVLEDDDGLFRIELNLPSDPQHLCPDCFHTLDEAKQGAEKIVETKFHLPPGDMHWIEPLNIFKCSRWMHKGYDITVTAEEDRKSREWKARANIDGPSSEIVVPAEKMFPSEQEATDSALQLAKEYINNSQWAVRT